jgi:hypothetical protein
VSHETYIEFQTTHTDPDVEITLPTNIARKLSKRPDYKPGTPKVANRKELHTYNTLLADNGKEAADQWLNREWG